MAGVGPGQSDKDNAEKPEVENGQSRIAVFFEEISKKDKNQNRNGHGPDEIENLIRQAREPFGLIKACQMEHDSAHKENDNEKGEMLSPGGDILCDFDEPRLKP